MFLGSGFITQRLASDTEPVMNIALIDQNVPGLAQIGRAVQRILKMLASRRGIAVFERDFPQGQMRLHVL